LKSLIILNFMWITIHVLNDVCLLQF